MSNILIVCPSIYPEKLKIMMESLKKTESKNTLIVSSSQGTVTEALNRMFIDNQDYDFYFIANDDLVFHTPQWDIKLANKGKICYGDDGFQHDNLATFPMIDGDIVRAIGWLQMPKLLKYFGDNVWHTLGHNLGILQYKSDVKIQHNWDRKLDQEKLRHDQQEYINWAYNRLVTDMQKIRKVLYG